jgi:hypothetical protein
MSLKESLLSNFSWWNWKSWRPQQAYSPIHITGDDDRLNIERGLNPGDIHQSRNPRRLYLKDLTVLVYMVVSLGLLLRLTTSSPLQWSTSSRSEAQPTIMLSPCGSTPAEARAAGCSFDMMAFSWLPPRCYDSELVEEFREFKNWGYWLDRNRTKPVSLEVALTGEIPELYTEFEYHLRHCTFLWRKMHRALLSDRGGKLAIDSVTAGYAHTEHCSKMLINQRKVALDVINAIIVVKYPDCGMA